MAQSGYTAIQLYSSPTPGATPAASNLTNGELAINVADGRLYYKNTAGNTQVIANSAWSSSPPSSITISAGTTSVATNNIVFASSTGVSFGLNGNTVTAQKFNTSYSPLGQLSGYGPTSTTNVASNNNIKFVYPLILQDGLIFQQVRGGYLSLANNMFSAQALTYATVQSTNVAFTQEYALSYGVYSKTGDTLTSVTNLKGGIQFAASYSMSTATTNATATSYARSTTATFTLSVPTSTAASGPVYSTATLSFSGTGNNFATSLTSNTLAGINSLQFYTSVSGSNATGNRLVSAVASAPITLQPNTYFIVQAAGTQVTYATTGVALTNAGITAGGTSGNQVYVLPNGISTNQGFSAGVSRYGTDTTPQFDDFNMLYLRSAANSASATYSFYDTYNIAGALPASYASTTFGTTATSTAALTLTFYAPIATFE